MIAAPPPVAYSIYDSVQTDALAHDPSIGVYATGPYAAPGSIALAHRHTLWIDVNGSDPKADVLDIEPGDARPSDAGPWAVEHERETRTEPVLYSDRSEWPAVRASVRERGLKVKYWVSDPTGVPHLVPGSDVTQWKFTKYYDISETRADFWATRRLR